MPTRQVESIHEAEQNHPVSTPNTPAVESPSADLLQGSPGLPADENQDDSAQSDQDIDTAGTEADDLSPTKSLFLALTPSLQRG